jgi:hypothetical protein
MGVINGELTCFSPTTDKYQINVTSSFLYVFFVWIHWIYLEYKKFRDIDRDGVLGAATSLDWSAVWFMAGVNKKVECFYTIFKFPVGYICDCASRSQLV